MNDAARPPAKNPCGSCPYRQDVPSGIWDRSEYEKLPEYDKSTVEQVLDGVEGAFFCHQQDGRLCAGWVGCHDMTETLAVRLNAKFWSDEVIDAVFDYETDVPLFESGQAAHDHGVAELYHPSEKASKIIDKLLRTKKVSQG